MKKLFVSGICLLICLVSTYTISAEVEPTNELVRLIAGDSCTRNITVTNTFNKAVNVQITTTISPDGEGINITYKPMTIFHLSKWETTTIEMLINTSFSLMPQTYIIETTFFYESEAGEEEGTHEYKTHVYPPTPPEDDNIVDPSQNDTSNETTNDKSDNSTDDTPPVNKQKDDNNYLWLIAIPIALTGILGSLYYFKKRRTRKND